MEEVSSIKTLPVKTGSVRAGEIFSSRLGVLTATLGSAVGLGNIWRFPYLTGSNGGAAFLIIYLICTVLVGIQVMVGEQMLGRAGKGNAIAALRALAPGKAWWLVGAAGVISAFLIMGFYSEVAGWVFAYIFKSLSGSILSTDPQVTTQAFTSLIANPTQSLVWQWIVLAVTGGILLFGVTKGIERTTKTLMPVLFLLLILVGIRSLTLPGAAQGLTYLFKPDFSVITADTFLEALGLSFFKLSVGMGCMMTYGSYFRSDQNIPTTATRVALADLMVSLMAGIAIFPAVFAFGFKPESGPSLLFITIPAVFASMPLGNVFMVAFFVLTAIASIGAMLSLLEVIVTFFNQQLGLNRKLSVVLTAAALAVFGSAAALSNSTLANVKILGLTFFDLYDYMSSNVLMPLGGLLISVFIGWIWGYPNIRKALSNEGMLKNERVIGMFFGLIKFVTPALIVIVLLNKLNIL
ncbi:Na+-dependent transporters of the SNF family [Longilinea arvoryzae]|uniref:Transporter n=1 Tax=Longilinea arvoryzae TaxID=360412 RepID=A0A0S7BMZ3_9CHLR|nr:sodium-dependent transporter [Longilinea arvoryzae]GAP15634.1 Na+-dependent transporters of the SNF family [Longilinea arvoryzae]